MTKRQFIKKYKLDSGNLRQKVEFLYRTDKQFFPDLKETYERIYNKGISATAKCGCNERIIKAASGIKGLHLADLASKTKDS